MYALHLRSTRRSVFASLLCGDAGRGGGGGGLPDGGRMAGGSVHAIHRLVVIWYITGRVFFVAFGCLVAVADCGLLNWSIRVLSFSVFGCVFLYHSVSDSVCVYLCTDTDEGCG